MPIYDYQCTDCHQTYDVFHKVREVEEDIICPSCNSRKHVRLISAPSINMNGRSRESAYSAPPPSCADGSCCGGACGLD